MQVQLDIVNELERRRNLARQLKIDADASLKQARYQVEHIILGKDIID